MVLVGESDREYSCQDKDVEICIVSSSGTFVNSQQTSKEHIIPLLFVLFGPVCKTVCWLVEIGGKMGHER